VNKYLLVFFLALILCGAIALSHESSGLTASSREFMMKRFSLLLLVLIFSGLIALSHVPREAIAMKEVESERVYNLTSVEATDSSTVEVDGIHLETVVFNQIWRIPANLHGVNTPVQFGVRITNKTSESIRVPLALSFDPKIVKMDGQELKIVNNVISSGPRTLKNPFVRQSNLEKVKLSFGTGYFSGRIISFSLKVLMLMVPLGFMSLSVLACTRLL
jgi:hypothetical protein